MLYISNGLKEVLYLLMSKPISRIRFTTFFLEIVKLAHQEILMQELVLFKVEQFIDNLPITVNVEKLVLVKLISRHYKRPYYLVR